MTEVRGSSVRSRCLRAASLVLVTVLAFPQRGASALEPSLTTYTIFVGEDGSATWTIERTIPLRTDTDRIAFERYLSQFDQYRPLLEEEFRNVTTILLRSASDATGRPMRADDISVEAALLTTATGSFGVIRYRFRWTGFGKIDGSSIYCGDVFVGGLYLYEDDTLVVKCAGRYEFAAWSPPADGLNEKEITWRGRRRFGDGEPRFRIEPISIALRTERNRLEKGEVLIVRGTLTPFVTQTRVIIEYSCPNGTVVARSATTSPDGAFSDAIRADKEGSWQVLALTSDRLIRSNVALVDVVAPYPVWLIVFGGVAALVAIGLVVLVVAIRRGPKAKVLEEVLITDVERVLRLLDTTGGVMFQSEMVRQTGFSRTKVSQILKRLEEEGRVVRMRRGRDNIVRLVR